jgi:ubiquinone/menaquinone biosynthesis C-methylase UbiE
VRDVSVGGSRPTFVAARYDKLANYIKFYEWLLCVPAVLRRTAAERLDLRNGSRVLEIGCGTGLNLPYLRAAVGPRGHVYGVDISAGMLAKARTLCKREGWTNVTLTHGDALNYAAPEQLDGVLFGLSYNTMPHHKAVLAHVLRQLPPGGRIVIMDGKVPPGAFGQMVLPFGVWLMNQTLLGNPYIRPWEQLAAVTVGFQMQDFLFGSYYVCRGIKSYALGAARARQRKADQRSSALRGLPMSAG